MDARVLDLDIAAELLYPLFDLNEWFFKIEQFLRNLYITLVKNDCMFTEPVFDRGR